MPKKQKKQEAGVPEWVVTYGDMMSLLLCFFILLAAFSELKKEHEYQRVITAVKEAFGYSGGVGVLPVDDPPLRSMIELLEDLAVHQAETVNQSEAIDPSLTGRNTKVSKVQEGLMFTIGGHLTFEAGSAELKGDAKKEIAKIAQLLRGRNNKIMIRGHAASKRLPSDSPYKDLMDLSFYRAKAVADLLVDVGGLQPSVIGIEARADREPLVHRQYSEHQQVANRRVEIIMTEVLIDQLNSDHDYADEGLARGADPVSGGTEQTP